MRLQDPLADLGQEAWRHAFRHAYLPGPAHALLGLAWPLIALGAAAGGLVLFRRSRHCAALAHTRPRLYRLVHAPRWVPLGILLGALGLALGAPGYVEGLQAYRPGTWPSLGTLSPAAAHRILAGSLAAGLGAALLGLIRLGHAGKTHDKGSARWAKWAAVKVHPTWRWSLPLRVSYRGSMAAWTQEAGQAVLAPSEEAATRHYLLVGQTGSGKGYTVFAHLLASSRVPYVYQDVKGQCPGQHMVKARFGRAPIRWGCAAQGGWPSLGWNPLEECRRDPRPSDAFAAVAAALIPRKDAAEDWVTDLSRPILAHVLEHGGYPTLGEVQDALMARGVDEVLAEAQVPRGLVAAMEGKNVREYLGTTVYSALANFQGGWGREVTSTHDFGLEEVARTCTYVLSAEPEATRRTPITVFWNLLLRRLLRSSEPVPLTLLFDEALAAGKIPSIRDALVTLRDRRVCIVFGTQHLSGLREVYGPVEGESIIASFTSRIVLLNGLDPRDREWLVKSLGQRTIREQQNKTTVTTPVPLMTLDDLGRRASTEGVFWAVLDGPGLTRTGEPIVARMVGGPKDLLRPPHEERPSSARQAPEPPLPAIAPLPSPGIDLDDL
jgi:type IV secretory pathway TraG/TraD family ATPase VirD4